MFDETKTLKRAVRLVVVVILILFVLQCILISKHGEPYPALTMPGFPGAGGYQDGQIHRNRFEAVLVTADGDEHSFSQHELLRDFPVSHRSRIASNFLSPIANCPTLTPEGGRLAEPRSSYFPGWNAGIFNRRHPDNVTSLQAWVRDRADALLPGAGVTRVEFRWHEEVCRIKAGAPSPDRRSTAVLVVIPAERAR